MIAVAVVVALAVGAFVVAMRRARRRRVEDQWFIDEAAPVAALALAEWRDHAPLHLEDRPARALEWFAVCHPEHGWLLDTCAGGTWIELERGAYAALWFSNEQDAWSALAAAEIELDGCYVVQLSPNVVWQGRAER